MLNQWREKQTPEKKAQLDKLEEQILKNLRDCKEGKI